VSTAVSNYDLIFDPFAINDLSLNSISGRVYKTMVPPGESGIQFPGIIPEPFYPNTLQYAFQNETPGGDWKLHVYDSGSGGTITNWGIDFLYDSGAPHDTPMSYTCSLYLNSVNINRGSTADIYPIQFCVTGLDGRVDYMHIDMDLTHPDISYLTFIIEAPDGTKSMFVSGTDLISEESPVRISFTDYSDLLLKFKNDINSNLQDGTYQPTEYNYLNSPGFGLPPIGGNGYYEHRLYPTLFGDPNGIWNLYIEDRGSGSKGTVSNIMICWYAEGVYRSAFGGAVVSGTVLEEETYRSAFGGIIVAGSGFVDKNGIRISNGNILETIYNNTVDSMVVDTTSVVNNTIVKTNWINLSVYLDDTGETGSGPLKLYLLRSFDGVNFDTENDDACLIKTITLNGSGLKVISVNTRESLGKMPPYWKIMIQNNSPNNVFVNIVHISQKVDLP
jgi:subtilisin-like proprotein convertase family protein